MDEKPPVAPNTTEPQSPANQPTQPVVPPGSSPPPSATSPAVLPTVTAQSPAPTGSLKTTPPKQKRNTKKILKLAVISMLVLLVVGGGTAFGYTQVRKNSPAGYTISAVDNLLFSEIDPQSMTMRTTLSQGGGDDAYTANLTVASQTSGENMEVSLALDGVAYQGLELSGLNTKIIARVVDGKLYMRIENLTKTIDTIFDTAISNLSATSGTTVPQMQIDEIKAPLLDLAGKISDKWVEFPESLKSESYTNCFDSFGSSATEEQKDELTKAYKDNAFLEKPEKKPDEQVNGVDSKHYVYGVNDEKAAGFVNNLMGSNAAQDMFNCLEGSGVSTDESQESAKAEDFQSIENVEVWITKQDRLFSRLLMNIKSEAEQMAASFDVTLGYESVSISPPEDAIPYETVIGDIGEVTEGLFGSLLYGMSPSEDVVETEDTSLEFQELGARSDTPASAIIRFLENLTTQ